MASIEAMVERGSLQLRYFNCVEVLRRLYILYPAASGPKINSIVTSCVRHGDVERPRFDRHHSSRLPSIHLP